LSIELNQIAFELLDFKSTLYILSFQELKDKRFIKKETFVMSS